MAKSSGLLRKLVEEVGGSALGIVTTVAGQGSELPLSRIDPGALIPRAEPPHDLLRVETDHVAQPV